jgi:hypothetical protein
MIDETESIRRRLQMEINLKAASRESLELEHGEVWNTEELSREFIVVGFIAPFVVVQRKSDGKKGSFLFQHEPRFFFGFLPD